MIISVVKEKSFWIIMIKLSMVNGRRGNIWDKGRSLVKWGYGGEIKLNV